VSAVAPTAPQDPHATTCPRCGSPLAAEQDWCLDCGAAARTRLVPAPNWRAPVALLAALLLVAVLALAAAFVALTRDDEPRSAPAGGSPPAAPAGATRPAPPGEGTQPAAPAAGTQPATPAQP
jgi:hypothetical protein